MFTVISSLGIKSWYSFVLLEQHSVSEKASDKTSSSGMMKITPTLALFYCVALSKNIFHSSDISINKTFSSSRSSENFY